MNDIMGAYAYEEYIGSYYDSEGVNDYTLPKTPCFWICSSTYGDSGWKDNSSFYNYYENETTTYSLIEIDEEYFNTFNTITLSLKKCLIPDLEALGRYKDKYVFQIYNDKEYLSPMTFFYLDGTLYRSEEIWKLKKIENAEHPLSIHKGEFPKDSILNELDGKTFFCEYFTISNWEANTYTISFDKRLEEKENIFKNIQYVAFSASKYIKRYDDIAYNFNGSLYYWIYDNPSYEVIEMDEEFLNNGIYEQGFMLHKLIRSPEELNNYQKKYAIIITLQEEPSDEPCRMTYFYLDGKLYYSPDENSRYNVLLPMEEMEGKGIIR